MDQLADFRFLFALHEGGSSFEEVVQARLSVVSGVVDLEVVLPDKSDSDELIHCRWE